MCGWIGIGKAMASWRDRLGVIDWRGGVAIGGRFSINLPLSFLLSDLFSLIRPVLWRVDALVRVLGPSSFLLTSLALRVAR